MYTSFVKTSTARSQLNKLRDLQVNVVPEKKRLNQDDDSADIITSKNINIFYKPFSNCSTMGTGIGLGLDYRRLAIIDEMVITLSENGGLSIINSLKNYSNTGYLIRYWPCCFHDADDESIPDYSQFSIVGTYRHLFLITETNDLYSLSVTRLLLLDGKQELPWNLRVSAVNFHDQPNFHLYCFNARFYTRFIVYGRPGYYIIYDFVFNKVKCVSNNNSVNNAGRIFIDEDGNLTRFLETELMTTVAQMAMKSCYSKQSFTLLNSLEIKKEPNNNIIDSIFSRDIFCNNDRSCGVIRSIDYITGATGKQTDKDYNEELRKMLENVRLWYKDRENFYHKIAILLWSICHGERKLSTVRFEPNIYRSVIFTQLIRRIFGPETASDESLFNGLISKLWRPPKERIIDYFSYNNLSVRFYIMLHRASDNWHEVDWLKVCDHTLKSEKLWCKRKVEFEIKKLDMDPLAYLNDIEQESISKEREGEIRKEMRNTLRRAIAYELFYD